MKNNSAALSPDNKIINGLWVCEKGGLLSNMELLCIHSFCANGHDFRLWVYNDIVNAPKNTTGGKLELCNANEILPQNKIFRGKRGTLVHFADFFRWKLLYERGGWWSDMDMVCLRPFNFSDEIVFGCSSENVANINILEFPSGHFLLKMMLDEFTRPLRIGEYDTPNRKFRKIITRLLFLRFLRHKDYIIGSEEGSAFPFSLAVKYFKLLNLAKSQYVFSPINSFSEMTNEELHNAGILEAILNNSHAIHWYHGTWRKRYYRGRGRDRNDSYMLNSPFEILKRRYLPE